MAAQETVHNLPVVRKTNFLNTISLSFGAIFSLLAIFALSGLASAGDWAPLVEARGNGFTEKRATGTEYLLGVGKADITGFDNVIL